MEKGEQYFRLYVKQHRDLTENLYRTVESLMWLELKVIGKKIGKLDYECQAEMIMLCPVS